MSGPTERQQDFFTEVFQKKINSLMTTISNSSESLEGALNSSSRSSGFLGRVGLALTSVGLGATIYFGVVSVMPDSKPRWILCITGMIALFSAGRGIYSLYKKSK